MCTFRALKRSAAYVQNIVFPYFFLPQLSRNIYPPLYPCIKQISIRSCCPNRVFIPDRFFLFFFFPLVKFSKSDAGGIKERAFSRRLASAQTQKSWVPSIYGYRANEREREREKRKRDEETIRWRRRFRNRGSR